MFDPKKGFYRYIMRVPIANVTEALKSVRKILTYVRNKKNKTDPHGEQQWFKVHIRNAKRKTDGMQRITVACSFPCAGIIRRREEAFQLDLSQPPPTEPIPRNILEVFTCIVSEDHDGNEIVSEQWTQVDLDELREIEEKYNEEEGRGMPEQPAQANDTQESGSEADLDELFECDLDDKNRAACNQ